MLSSSNSICTARLRVDEEYLIPVITVDTTLDYFIPTTTGPGACTFALVDYLVLVHNDFIECCKNLVAASRRWHSSYEVSESFFVSLTSFSFLSSQQVVGTQGSTHPCPSLSCPGLWASASLHHPLTLPLFLASWKGTWHYLWFSITAKTHPWPVYTREAHTVDGYFRSGLS